jgi:hypothetical protein
MTSVTFTSLSGTINASQLDTNFSDVVSIASSVGNEQLSGGITADKLTDRYSVTYDTICVIPSIINSSGGAILFNGNERIVFSAANQTGLVLTWQPIMKAGMEAHLCSISVQALAVVNDPEVNFYLNGDNSSGSLIGNQPITLAANATRYTLGATDPITNPVIAFSNGDYISVYTTDSGGGSRSEMRGVYVTFCMKYVLQA